MPPLDQLLSALQLHQWYPLAGLALALSIQTVRTNPLLAAYLWNWIPSGLRWLPAKLGGAAIGFVDAFSAGQPLGAALLAALGGALGVGLTSMGWAAALKESPIPWDGGSGGDPRSTSKLPPLDESSGPRSLNRFLVGVAVAMLGLVVLSACSSTPPVPKDPSARAEYFAERVREAVQAKEAGKAVAFQVEQTYDATLREVCSQLGTYVNFLPPAQTFDDVLAACKGYLSTPAPAKLEPAPEPAPASTSSPPAELAPPAPAASEPATT